MPKILVAGQEHISLLYSGELKESGYEVSHRRAVRSFSGESLKRQRLSGSVFDMQGEKE
jgi:hypothetical protein